MSAWTDKYLQTCEYDDRHGDLYVSYELTTEDKPTIVIGRLNAIMGKCEIFKVINDGEGLINISELARNWQE
jgi:hypothetical protein